MNTFQNTARFYDLDQHPKNNEDIPYYLQKAAEFGSPVLELACGTGRVAIPLAKAGFSVYGLDLSREMLSIFEEKRRNLSEKVLENLTIKQGEMTDFSFNMTFKLILIPFHSFQVLLTDKQAQKCLKCIADHLDDDGALILNVARLDEEIVKKWKEGFETEGFSTFLRDGKWLTRTTILQELNEKRRLMSFDNLYRHTNMKAEVKEFRDRLQIRFYNENDLRLLLDDAGFKVIEAMGGYEGSSVKDGDEFIFVCKRRNI